GVVAWVLLAGFGYLLSNIGGSPGPGGALSAASPSAASASAAAPSPAAPGLPAEGGGQAGSGPRARAPVPGPPPGFVVTESGTRYQRATLGVQARRQMAMQAASNSAEGQPTEAQPAASNSAAGGGSAPSQAWAAGVLRLTGNTPPSLVARAPYEGNPAYVIAVRTRVWVTGLGCAAGNPALITSIPLAGPG